MDWNNDGKNDLLAGDTRGQVWLYLNEGTASEPKLAAGVRVESNGHPITGADITFDDGAKPLKPQPLMGRYSKIHWADMTGDGLSDLLIGQAYDSTNHIVIYKNVGTQTSPKLAQPEVYNLPKNTTSRPSPYVADLDGDGIKDMICGTDGKDILFFENTGTNAAPKWKNPEKLKLKGKGFENGNRHRLAVTDWNEDGKTDLIMGDYYLEDDNISGNIWLFLGK